MQEEEYTYHPLLQQMQNQNAFGVPDQYFESMHLAINEKIELLNIAPVLFKEEPANQFSIPTSYFENFQSNLNAALELENAAEEVPSIILEQLKVNSFSTPPLYFEKFENALSHSLEEIELKNLAPKLFEAQKQAAFSVPPDYLDNFASQIQFAIRKKEQQQINIFSQIWNLLKPQYSVSFALACLLVWLGLNFKQTNNLSDAELFAQINVNEANDYLNQNISSQIDDQMLMEHVDNAKLNPNTIDKETEDYLLNNIDVSTLEDAI